jgi:hypothetical protein
MTKHEQIYALLVEANPYPDVESLPETFEEGRFLLHAVGSSAETERDERSTVEDSAARVRVTHRRRGRVAVVCAAVLVFCGMGAVVARDLETTTLPVGSDPAVDPAHTELVVEFVSRLEAGNVDGAEELLADPLGTIWFIPIGQVSDTRQVRDYLDFYVAVGVETEISGCVEQIVGPLTEVTCDANQTAGVLAGLELDLPPFSMTFNVRDDGIQQIGWEFDNSQQFGAAFNRSRFFEFRNVVLRPLGLVQGNGDPVWSKENGERMQDLVDDFVSGSS